MGEKEFSLLWMVIPPLRVAITEGMKWKCKTNGYRQKFVALKTGMTEAKISRLFKGEQEMNEQDMELLSGVFMKKPDFFMREKFDEKVFMPETSAAECYLGETAERMKEYTDILPYGGAQ